MSVKKILVLDGEQRSALACVRSLGSRDHTVLVGASGRGCLAAASRFCGGELSFPAPDNDTEAFAKAVANECLQREIDVLLPMTELSTLAVTQHRKLFTDTEIPFAPYDTINKLSDKWKLMATAETLGIPIPKTLHVTDPQAIGMDPDQLNYPIVLKPYRSRIQLEDDSWLSTSVDYAYSASQLTEMLLNHPVFSRHEFLLQEYIDGPGKGIFLCYKQGKCIAQFAHKRLLEKPPTGGVSVLSESIEVDQQMVEFGQRLLDSNNWEGVAMVEFKESSSGKPYLMEINARFWGSLQLAIDAGVDFPHILVSGMPVNPKYQQGLRMRWLLGDLDRTWLIVKGRASIGTKIGCLLKFLNPVQKNTRYEVNRLSDIKPFFREIKLWVSALFGG